MATNDLSNKEKVALMYMKEMLKKEFPSLDTSDTGAFMEMFGLPHIKLLTPLLDFADRIKLTQSLDNYDLMTEAEMDAYAAGHFFYRKNGEYAVGYVTLSFDDIPANGVIQIPAGTTVESTQGYRFRSLETIVLDEEDLANYYDPDLFYYNIPVLFEAENPGAKYNVAENEIVTPISTLSHLANVTNEIAFKGGKDKETNFELAVRIRDTAGTPNLGVERGWQRFCRGFDEVDDVIVAGFGHPLMKRDIVGVTPAGRFSSSVSPDVHWGGKVDLHIRGKRLEDYIDTEKLQLNEDGQLVIHLTKHPVYDIAEITFSSPRFTDPNLDPTFFVVKNFLLIKDENRETIGTLSESAWVIILDDRLDENDSVTVRYRYNQLIEDINNSLYQQDNRPPASDVLLKEAKKKYIHSAMIIRLESIIGIKEKDKSIIRQRLYNWVSELPTGSELQFSDFSAPIYQFDTDSIDTKVDYIGLPAQFIVTDYDNKFLYYCLNQERRDFLDELQRSSVYFSEKIPYFMENVTIYDFFDIMHLLTYQNVAKDAWKTISLINHDWGKRVAYINMAKRMLAYVNSVQKLSPPRWVSQENDYFELGNFTIYEDVTYTASELEGLVTLFENIANPGEEEQDMDNMLHLTVYCAVLLYIMSTEKPTDLNVRELFDWLVDLTKGTPVDYVVHH